MCLIHWKEKRLKKCNQVKDLFWEHLEQSPPGIVWTFGAHHAPKSCEPDGPDLASNLICNGWAGILVEGHPSRRAVLQNLFGHRHELVILSQLAMRDTVGSVLEDATWNNPQLRNQEVDLLQITFGANDCEIIRGILERGFRPRFVRAIFWHPVPPPLVYQPRVHRLLGDWYEDAFEATGEGCSLQAVADSLTDHYMFWDFDGRDCEKANFVRKDLMDLLPTDQIFNEAELDLQARWAARFNNTACFLNNHVFDTLMVDPRLMQDPDATPSEKRLLWELHLKTVQRTDQLWIKKASDCWCMLVEEHGQQHGNCCKLRNY
ncbi:unnamed protein product [Durusdinium trenchii]|uniref:Uncharacterized protein n=1 Tax=Durusdinium trenchii TaxID=1381693 RepID=A0ABP0MGM0_9DINO